MSSIRELEFNLKNLPRIYESYLRHYRGIVEEARKADIEIPILEGESLVGEGGKIYDCMGPRSWDVKWQEARLYGAATTAAFARSASTSPYPDPDPESPDDIEFLLQYVNEPTDVLDGRLIMTSREGAKSMTNKGVVCICCEHTPGMSQADKEAFYEWTHVPLDDFRGCHPTDTVTFRYDDLELLWLNLLQAVDHFLGGKSVLAHCSQGQSRSGLFVTMMFGLLYRLKCVKLDLSSYESYLDPRERVFAAIFDFIKDRRRVLAYSCIWWPFIDFLVYHTSFFSASPLGPQ